MTSGGTLQFKFYGEGKEETPDLILCFGAPDTFYTTSSRKTGLYLGRSVVIDEDGEQYNKVKIMTSSGTQTYKVTKEVGDTIDTDTGGVGIISYSTGLLNSKSDIMYTSTNAKLASTHDEWINENTNMYSGVIEKKAGKRIYFENGDAIYTADSPLCIELNEGSTKGRFESISANDLKSGDTIFYKKTYGLISQIIVVK